MNPRRKPSLEIQHVGNEVLVNDPENGKVHVLNSTAGAIIVLCDGAHSIDDISRTLGEGTDVDHFVIEGDVRAIVTTFTSLRLMVSD